MSNRFVLALFMALLIHVGLIGLSLSEVFFSGPTRGNWTEPTFLSVPSLKSSIGKRDSLLISTPRSNMTVSERSMPGPVSKGGENNILTQKQIVQDGNLLPVYPSVALENGWEGLVELKLTLSDEGKVIESVVVKSSGYSLLDSVAQKTSTTWKFEKHKGVKSLIIPIKFTIDS